MNIDDRPSYYAVLNVPREATEQAIRRAYRHQAQTFHPDKHVTHSLGEDAAGRFALINEAYEVLTDPQKRRIYDIYGKQGLVAGLDVGSKVKSAEELRADWEKFKEERDESSGMKDVTHSTHLQCMVDSTSFLDYNAPFATRKAEIESILIQSTIDKQLTPQHAGYLGGNVLRQGSKDGGGNLLLGCRGLVDSKTGYAFDAQWGTKSEIGFQTTRQLAENTQGIISTSYSAAHGPGLTISSTRGLTDTTHGSASFVAGPPQDSGVHLSLSQRTDDMSISTKVQVGALYGITGRVTKTINSKTSFRAVGRFGFNAVDADVGIVHKISDRSQVTLSVIYGVQGTYLKTRWSMGNFTLDVPIVFSRDPDEWKVALAAVTLTPLGVTLFRCFVIRPLINAYRSHQALQERKKHAEEIRQQIDSAMSAQALQKTVAQRLMKQEALKSGLVIIKAEYGIFPTTAVSLSQNGDSNQNDVPPAVLDVTAAVQYQVSDSQLEFYENVSKAGLMGFCDVAPNQPKILKIQYLYKNCAYRAEVSDMDGLKLPRQGRRIEDIHEAEDLLALAQGANQSPASASTS